METSTKKFRVGSRSHSLGAHVEDVLRSRIRGGVYSPGSLLPGRRALCEELRVAPTTLDKAIKCLLADGTVRSESRRGTYVADTLPGITAERRPIVAQSPRHNASSVGFKIGVVSTVSDALTMDPSSDWFAYMIIHALEDRVCPLGNQVCYLKPMRADDRRDPLEVAVDQFREAGIVAMIIVAYHDNKRPLLDAALEKAKYLDMPVVVISSSSREWPVSHVWTDNRIAGRNAAEHLLENGHERIAFVAPFTFAWQEQRIQGILDAMRETGCHRISSRFSVQMWTSGLTPQHSRTLKTWELCWLAD